MEILLRSEVSVAYGDQLDPIDAIAAGKVTIEHRTCLGGHVSVSRKEGWVCFECALCGEGTKVAPKELVIGLRQMLAHGGRSEFGKYYQNGKPGYVRIIHADYAE